MSDLEDECEDRSGYVMRCHYEVLSLDRKCTEPEIRRAYKMAALRCHPDKNYGRLEEADAEFKEVQNSYTVLIDPDERAWYDSHRISILRGGDGSSAPDEINLFSFMSPKAYSGYGDGSEGFFGVYNKVFNTLVKEESDYNEKILKEAPRFGKSTADYADGVGAFYVYWKNFNTSKNFAWKEEFKVSDMPDRWHRREAEKANAKERNSARREYVAMVQQLAIFLYNRDPRVAKEKERLEAERLAKEEEKARKAEEAARRRRESNKKLWAEIAEKEAAEEEARAARGEELDGSTLEVLYEKQRQMEALRKKGGAMKSSSGGHAGEFAHLDMLPDGDEDSSAVGSPVNAEAMDFYKCLACKKTFRTDKMWAEHVKSGKHKTKINGLVKQGVDVTAMLVTPKSDAPEGEGDVEKDGNADEEEPSKNAQASSSPTTAAPTTKNNDSDDEDGEEEAASTMAPKKGKNKKDKKKGATPVVVGTPTGGKCDTLDPEYLLNLAAKAATADDTKKKGAQKKGKAGHKSEPPSEPPAEPTPTANNESKNKAKKVDKKALKKGNKAPTPSESESEESDEPVARGPRNAFAALRK